jgi:PEP-CTERM motif
MRSSKRLLIALAFLLVFALGASSVMATSYIRGYVKPSGDGAACSTIDPTMPPPPTPSCVDVSGNLLTFGTSPTTTTPTPTYQVIDVLGLTSGTEVDFAFSGGTPVNSPSSPFSVLACAYESEGNPVSPGIYTSSGGLLSTKCTQLGDYFAPGFTFPSFITEDTCATPNTVCLTFSGSGMPADWFFTEAATGPTFTGLTVIPPASAPEPASLSLLAAGLVGLGALRRKRTV